MYVKIMPTTTTQVRRTHISVVCVCVSAADMTEITCAGDRTDTYINESEDGRTIEKFQQAPRALTATAMEKINNVNPVAKCS